MPARFAFRTPGRPVVVEFVDLEGAVPPVIEGSGGDAVWAERLLPEVAELLPEWSGLAAAGEEPPLVRVERRRGGGERYHFNFRYPGLPGGSFEVEGQAAAADAVATALTLCFTQQDRRALQVHAAALVFPRGILVLHGGSQAGKSTLAVQGACLGLPLAADDRLVVTVSPEGLVEATALGVAPRLRKPLPPDAGAAFAGFVAGRIRREFPAAARLALQRPAEQLPAGQRLPVLGLVSLERRARGAIEFAPQGQGAALKSLFSTAAAPHLDTETMTRRLAKIVRRVPSWRLAFTSSRDTAALLLERFGGA